MSDVTGKELQADVSRWMEWIREMMASNAKMLAIAEKRSDCEHCSNLILDSEGRVWGSNFKGFHELRRENDAPFSNYVRTGRQILSNIVYSGGAALEVESGVVFVAKGWDKPEEDWCWERARTGRSTLQYLQSSRRRYEDGIAFGEAILKIPAERIDEWAKCRASVSPMDGNMRSMDSLDGDWDSFRLHFCLPRFESVPDDGSLRCFVHLVVDRAAGLMDTAYCF